MENSSVKNVSVDFIVAIFYGKSIFIWINLK